MKTIEIRVNGQVQGVFFRKSTQQKAQELGLTGTVRNKMDGSVEIIAVGAEEKLGLLVMWCLEGSPSSKVHKVTVKALEQNTGFDSFDIIYSS